MTKTINNGINQMTKRKSNIKKDHSLVEVFWETFFWLSTNERELNHSGDQELVAVCLPEFNEVSEIRSQNRLPTIELTERLKAGNYFKYIDTKMMQSARTGRQLPCMIFERPEENPYD
jgi:hypothetical protein